MTAFYDQLLYEAAVERAYGLANKSTGVHPRGVTRPYNAEQLLTHAGRLYRDKAFRVG